MSVTKPTHYFILLNQEADNLNLIIKKNTHHHPHNPTTQTQSFPTFLENPLHTLHHHPFILLIPQDFFASKPPTFHCCFLDSAARKQRQESLHFYLLCFTLFTVQSTFINLLDLYIFFFNFFCELWLHEIYVYYCFRFPFPCFCSLGFWAFVLSGKVSSFIGVCLLNRSWIELCAVFLCIIYKN